MKRTERPSKYSAPERMKEFSHQPLCEHRYDWTLVAQPDFGWDDLICFCVMCGVIRCSAERNGDHGNRCLQTRHHPDGHIYADGTWEPLGGYDLKTWLTWTLPPESEKKW